MPDSISKTISSTIYSQPSFFFTSIYSVGKCYWVLMMCWVLF
jgi:hypothetical protein